MRLQHSHHAFIYILLSVILSSCSDNMKTYHIGVSQCSEDIWREKLNRELRTATYFYDNIDVCIASGDDNDRRQIEQIERYIDRNVDLLIVAPNQMMTMSSVIDRAHDKGIPVIVFDRKTSSKKFTAYIGADNYNMGFEMGRYIAAQMDGKGRVLEIMGLKGSSPAIDRHNGFLAAIKKSPGIEIVASLQGDWTRESAIKAINDYNGDLSDIDYVFGQNDRMALGAREALNTLRRNEEPPSNPHTTKYCGIDGLSGKGNGIESVRQGLLDASYIYPTRGDLVMRLAVNILKGKPYERDNLMKSAIVTRENVEVMLMQAEEMEIQNDRLDRLHNKIDWYFTQYRHQQVYLVLLVVIIVLILLGAWFALTTMYRRHQLEREAFSLVVGNLEKESSARNVAKLTPEEQKQIELSSNMDDRFLEQLRQIVQSQMSDSEFTVETLASKMGLSRVQLYRKTKLLTGRTPVDIIRQSRLNRAKALLSSSHKSISEVAYEVGFSAPSYFAKCFKDEFGISPTEVLQLSKQ